MKRTAIAVAVLVLLVCFARAEDSTGIVTVTGLRMRSTPDLKGQVVALLDKGSMVTIVDKSKDEIKVGDTRSPWFKVSHDGRTGWIFGGYVAMDYDYACVDKGCGVVAWPKTVEKKGGDYSFARIIVVYDKAAKKETNIEVDPESLKFSFSENKKYLALDSGTDVVGGLLFYRVSDGKRVHSVTYSPRNFSWEGNRVRYRNILCYDDGFVLYEDEVFDDGRVVKTGKYGKGSYHSGLLESGGCSKYGEILKKARVDDN